MGKRESFIGKEKEGFIFYLIVNDSK